MRMSKTIGKKAAFPLSGARVLALGFVALILAGSLLLTLPVSSSTGERTDFLTCLFTSTSASCVTGLILCDTATSWSAFGQAVILFMIQIGGVGFMTVALMLSIMVRRSISPRERLIAAQSFNLPTFGGVVRLVKKIAAGTAFIELLGAAMLSIRFIPLFGVKGIWYSVFTSVSAFCNAGFDLMGGYSGQYTSLSAFCCDPLVNITVVSLIVVGGIGFIVWDELLKFFKDKKHLSAYTKLMLSASAILIFGGAAVIAALEWNNAGTLGGMTTQGKLLAALFQSVTARTAGFNTIDLAAMQPITKLAFLGLMFIGGCSGSTAGGVKVGTAAVAMFSVLSILRGRKAVIIFKRRVAPNAVLRAYGIIALQFAVTVIGGIIISTCGASMMSSMFEAFSASATVGVTLSLTGSMNIAGKLCVILMMYFGRVGILTVSYAIMSKMSDSEPAYSCADARIPIG